jgi:hypothetical protein
MKKVKSDDEKDSEEKKKRKRKNKNPSVAQDMVRGAAVGIGVGAAVSGVDDFGNHRQYDEYKCRQGHGFAGEDIAQDNHPEWHKEPLERKKNEPDFTDKDGTPIQVKACKNAKKTVENLYEHGNFKYEDNIIAVPDDQEDDVRAIIRKKGRKEKVTNIGADYKTIRDNNKRSLGAIRYDAGQALRNPEAYVFGAGVSILSYKYFYYKEVAAAKRTNKNTKKWKLQCKAGAKAAASGAFTVAVYVAGCTLKGWLKRPK